MAPKIFEVGDVLPATTHLRISWSDDDVFSGNNNYFNVFSNGNANRILEFYVSDLDDQWASSNKFIFLNGTNYFLDYFGDSVEEHFLDTSTWSVNERTISNQTSGNVNFFWEDLNAPTGYSITYEENGGSTVTDLTEQTKLPTPLPTTTKANHVFAGWYYDNLFTQKANAGDELEGNVTLYAKWYTPTTWCEDIADAIREKDGTTEPIKHLDFPDKIKNIQGAKPEETKTVTPNFASGNVVVTPTSGKVMTQVTINKDSNLIAGNIKKDVTVHGITGSSFIAIELTQAQYNALATKDANTYYLING